MAINITEIWLKHRKSHFRETLKPLREGYQFGLETGDFTYASFCGLEEGAHLYYSGQELVALEQKMKSYSEACLQLKQENAWYSKFFGKVS
ncbi:hypothetical protein [Candidatus Parabeggiatoa sp. HSG14]|uniref:hypothetical protein n=1 Tax=Candidatus Parabeggiatoa sp. HSG14 TaxID=3055593 RepID=UPI0025A8016B|nr:hypothetical protein [Thiotrichales bacterium HSG14]